MTEMYIIWSVLIVAFAVFEGVTTQLVSIWFMLGSVAGLISAFCNVPIIWQIIIFIAVSVVALIATRPLVKKHINTKVERTNLDRCVGLDAVVLEDIDNLRACGQVKVDGKVWTARSSDQAVIEKDTIVTVEKIDGVKLIVSAKQTVNNF